MAKSGYSFGKERLVLLLVERIRVLSPDLASFLFGFSETNISMCCSHYVHDSPPRTISCVFVGLIFFGSLAILARDDDLQASTAEDWTALWGPGF